MGYDPGKYTVVNEYGNNGNGEELEEGEFFVLRRGDMLATGTLWNYLNNIRMILELSETMDGQSIDMATRDHLEDLEASVHGLVTEWQADAHKLPD